MRKSNAVKFPGKSFEMKRRLEDLRIRSDTRFSRNGDHKFQDPGSPEFKIGLKMESHTLTEEIKCGRIANSPLL